MHRQVGFYEYSLSPYQLKPFKGFFQPGAYHLLMRTARQLAFMAPPCLVFYYISVWGDKQWEHNQRKVTLFAETD